MMVSRFRKDLTGTNALFAHTHTHTQCILKNKIKKAFTLVEIIIVIGILGIVAGFVIPAVMANVTDRVFTQSADIALKKMTEATNQMRSNNAIDAYATSDLFADEFQKYMKISKRCGAGNLDKCFPPKFYTGTGKEITTSSDLKTGVDFGKATYTSSLVGLDLVDGTMILLAFNPACQWADPNDTTKGKDSTACVSMIYDTNGLKKPNKIGKDITTLNATITSCDGTKIGNMCVAGGDITGYAAEGTYVNIYGITYPNYWEGAKNACTAQNMHLPSKDELNTIYTNRASISGLNSAEWYWSSTEYGSFDGWGQDFSNGTQGGGGGKYYQGRVRCVR